MIWDVCSFINEKVFFFTVKVQYNQKAVVFCLIAFQVISMERIGPIILIAIILLLL